MTTTPNRGFTHLEPNADQPEVPVNTALDGLDTATSSAVAISIGTTSPLVVTLTQAQQAAGCLFVLTPTSPGPGADFTVQFAAFALGMFSVYNATLHSATLSISGQPLTAPVIGPGQLRVFQSDGTNVRSVDSVRQLQAQVTDPGSMLTVGDAQGAPLWISTLFSGATLLDCAAAIATQSSSGAITVQLRRNRAGVDTDMLSTPITINANKRDSTQAGTTQPVINTAGVLESDFIYFDVDAAGTGAKGLICILTFQLP